MIFNLLIFVLLKDAAISHVKNENDVFMTCPLPIGCGYKERLCLHVGNRTYNPTYTTSGSPIPTLSLKLN